jgi:hypothetical protein
MNTKKPHSPRIVLRKPPTAAGTLALAKAILQSITLAKTTFPSPNPTLVQFTTDVNALDTAEVAARARTKGAAQTRDAKLAVVVTDLGLLRAYVQSVADSEDPTNAASIAHAAGMDVRKSTTTTKADFGARPDKTLTGVIHVTVKVGGKRETHEWQQSLDGKTWTDMQPTMQGRITASGFSAGQTVYFRHRTITKAGRSDWSQPISVMAH